MLQVSMIACGRQGMEMPVVQNVYLNWKDTQVGEGTALLTRQVDQSSAREFEPLSFRNRFKRSIYEVDLVAQQVEHIPFKDRVMGSSPIEVT